jgi:hypothetical protein
MKGVSNFLTSSRSLIVLYALIVSLTFFLNSFPALSGDEYYSLFEESNMLMPDHHGLGYFAQLRLWKMVSDSDIWLRCLSVLWGAIALFACWRWGKSLGLQNSLLWHWCALLITNAYFVQYAFMIRFYIFFLATSCLVFWRYAEWYKCPGRKNFLWLSATSLLMLSSHLFSVFVLGIIGMTVLWKRKKKLFWILVVSTAVVMLSVHFWVPLRQLVLEGVYIVGFTRLTTMPELIPRGLNLSMLVKIPYLFFSLFLGQRVYPLWWWISFPAAAIAFFLSVRSMKALKRFPYLGVLVCCCMLSMLSLYLFCDPLLPKNAIGATHRYVIYLLPVMLLVFVLGTSGKTLWLCALWCVNLTGLVCLLFPRWAQAGDALVDWKHLLGELIDRPEETCILVDGRAYRQVHRYASPLIMITKVPLNYSNYERVLVVSNDWNIDRIRYLDQASRVLVKTHGLSKHIVQFPAQLVSYDRDIRDRVALPASRITLAEQDIRFPLHSDELSLHPRGFVRLDSVEPSVQMPISFQGLEQSVYVLTNYFQQEHPPVKGKPVMELQWLGLQGRIQTIVFHAGQETSSWDGLCDKAVPVASWEKKAHMLGRRKYSGAYGSFKAKVWAYNAEIPPWRVTGVRLRSLLDEGTVYYWGVLPRRPTDLKAS